MGTSTSVQSAVKQQHQHAFSCSQTAKENKLSKTDAVLPRKDSSQHPSGLLPQQPELLNLKRKDQKALIDWSPIKYVVHYPMFKHSTWRVMKVFNSLTEAQTFASEFFGSTIASQKQCYWCLQYSPPDQIVCPCRDPDPIVQTKLACRVKS